MTLDLLGWLRTVLGRRRPVTPPPAPIPRPRPVPQPGSALDALNRARIANGRPPLRADAPLETVALARVMDLAARGALEHGDYKGRIWAVHPGVPIGEVIAEGWATAPEAVAAWMGDHDHMVILLGDFDSAGMASATGPDGLTRWVADFCKLG